MAQGPGSGRVAEKVAPPVSQFRLWWLLSSVRDSKLQYLLRDFYQEQGISPDSPLAWSLESFLLIEQHGAQTGSQAAWPLCCSEPASGFSSSQGLLVREAGGGGLAVSVTPGQARVGRVLCTIHRKKTVARPEFLPGLGPQTPGREGQSTSMEKWPYNGPLN